jgi:Raf kinase inhibitor-like YbhB/YbcL family protein
VENMPLRREVIATIGALSVAGCLGDGNDADGATPAPFEGAMMVSSTAFEAGESIPERYTGDGADESPPLSVADAPGGSESFVLIVDDPDAPNPPFTHWLCWGIPPDTSEIPASIPQQERVPVLGDAVQGINDFDELGYRGPLPPEGDGPHRYRFTVRALDRALDLEPGADRAAVDNALEGGVMAQGRLVGTYER